MSLGSCPGYLCTRSVRPGMLMCAPCWRLVPREIKSLVMSAWRAVDRGELLQTWPKYVEARQAAIESTYP